MRIVALCEFLLLCADGLSDSLRMTFAQALTENRKTEIGETDHRLRECFLIFVSVIFLISFSESSSHFSARLSYLLPRMTLDLREFKLGVVWIHLLDLIPRWRAQYFDDLDQLIDPRVSGEDGLAQK